MATVASTQDKVPIAGMKDGIIIMKNGQYRIILEVAAVNYALKSEQEQNSLIFQFQSFLNSLHFPIQIVIQSKRLDLTPYLNKIKDLAKKQNNELLKIQTEDYVDFISQLIGLANIMKKTFYVVIGYQPLNVGNASFFEKIFHREKEVSNEIRIPEDEFKRIGDELRQRATTTASGLGGMGLHCRQLDTEESIELFYRQYNPEIAGKERLTDASEVSSSFITSESGTEEKNFDAEGNLIDNSAIVSEKEKKEASMRNQEANKTAERKMGMSEKEKTSPLTTPPTATAPTEKIPATQTNPAPNDNDVAGANNNQTMTNPTATPQQNQSTTPQVTEDSAIKDPDINKNFGW